MTLGIHALTKILNLKKKGMSLKQRVTKQRKFLLENFFLFSSPSYRPYFKTKKKKKEVHTLSFSLCKEGGGHPPYSLFFSPHSHPSKIYMYCIVALGKAPQTETSKFFFKPNKVKNFFLIMLKQRY